jgi:hypothetical protein
MTEPLTREQLLALPATTNLPTLGRAFGVSEPVARERHRLGEWERLGIRILRLGQQWRVITADMLNVLGVEPDPVPPEKPGSDLATVGNGAKHPEHPAW